MADIDGVIQSIADKQLLKRKIDEMGPTTTRSSCASSTPTPKPKPDIRRSRARASGTSRAAY
jgi:hypothetical protein